MNISLPLKDMTIEEKLQVMESLWEDLSQNQADFESPRWHGEELAARQAAVEKGEIGFTDWEEAKQEIRDSLQ